MKTVVLGHSEAAERRMQHILKTHGRKAFSVGTAVDTLQQIIVAGFHKMQDDATTPEQLKRIEKGMDQTGDALQFLADTACDGLGIESHQAKAVFDALRVLREEMAAEEGHKSVTRDKDAPENQELKPDETVNSLLRDILHKPLQPGNPTA